MTKFLKLISFVTLLVGSVGAFAQQGLFRSNLGFVGPQAVSSGVNVTLCSTTQTAAQCVAAPIAFTSDQAGASSITAPLAVGAGQFIQFYSAPGNYNLLVNFVNGPSDAGQQLIPINVPPDSAGNVALNDGSFYVDAASSCITSASTGSNTGTTTGNDGKVVIDGNTPALVGQRSNASGSHIIFYCQFVLPPNRVTSGKGATIRDITFYYSVQTTTATSQVTPTLNTFTAPAAGASETASAAALVAFGGTLAITPVIGSANLTAVSAGQYYSSKIALGTPAVLADGQVAVLTFEIDQSASAAQIVSTPGFSVHYSIPAL